MADHAKDAAITKTDLLNVGLSVDLEGDSSSKQPEQVTARVSVETFRKLEEEIL